MQCGLVKYIYISVTQDIKAEWRIFMKYPIVIDNVFSIVGYALHLSSCGREEIHWRE